MSRRRLRIEHALDALPDLDDLAPLREALVDTSAVDAAEAWGGSRPYATVGRRMTEPGVVEGMIPAIADQLRLRTEQVLGHAVRALRALEQGDPAEAAHALIAAGELEEASWRLDEADRYYRKALELGRKPRDRRGEALAFKRLGRVARTRGELPEALQLYQAGYDVSEAVRDAAGMVVGCLGIGNVLVDRGDWGAAREWYLRGVDQLRDRATPEFLHLCNALSVVERRLGRYDESEAWLARGERQAARVDDAGARRYLDHGRARLHLARGEPVEAERVLRRMLEDESEPIARISALTNLAEPLLLQGHLQEAEEALREAEGLAMRYRATRHLAYVYELLGKVAGARRDPEGFLFFEQALDLIRRHRLPLTQQAAVQQAYGMFEAELGSADAALARLSIARKGYAAVGAEVDAAAVEADMTRVRDRLEAAEESGRESDPREESTE